MEQRAAYHLEGINVSAVQNIQVEGRHSDQSCRHAISRARLEKLNVFAEWAQAGRMIGRNGP
jgi:hypothetical protein